MQKPRPEAAKQRLRSGKNHLPDMKQNPIIRLLKDWTLPVAMCTGAAVYFLFAKVPMLAPAKPFVNSLVAILTPLPLDEDISSLSAILLDDAYYEFLKQGRETVAGVTILGAEYLIPFKAKAWMDLTDRKANGESVDGKNIRKHKNDVFRLTELIDPELHIQVPAGVYEDIQAFCNRMNDEDVNVKQLGLVGKTKEEILEELEAMYRSR